MNIRKDVIKNASFLETVQESPGTHTVSDKGKGFNCSRSHGIAQKMGMELHKALVTLVCSDKVTRNSGE